MEQVVDPRNLEQAWRRVKRNRGAPGPDGMTIKQFESWCPEHWAAIQQQLLDGTYRPAPVRRKTIPKDGGGERLLGIPNVVDRLIQQAIAQVLTPIFDPEFSESSFGFRPGRSAHGAAKRVQQIIRQRHAHCIDVDLSKFFDRVQHDVLMSRVSRKVHDVRLLRLIGCFLRAGVMVDGVVQPTDEGSPQGGPLSPLLSNILLDDLDKELERRRLKFVRYADDFVIFVRSERAAQRVFSSVQRYLTQVLKLVVNEQKSSVRLSRDCEYLGFAFTGKRATITVAPKKLKAFKRRVKELTGRSRGVSMERRLTDLNRYVRGWTGYFGLAQQFDLFDRLDGWIRRRIRMCYWKQWRRPRTKVRNLVRLGVPLKMAILHAISRKSYWRLSRTPATRIAMPNKWLSNLGLLSLKQLWCDLAPLRGIA
ncbi:MAG TPA: group II intron reverse transcriptase/maturase [Fuerstia sp.]|nr:group II intron reverse transcriptase/maturase [Fuerstiella sp.]